MKRLIISFSGNKEELHKKLKAWAVESETSMNGTVIALIEKYLKNKSA